MRGFSGVAKRIFLASVLVTLACLGRYTSFATDVVFPKGKSYGLSPRERREEAVAKLQDVIRLGHLGGHEAVIGLTHYLDDPITKDSAIWYLGRMGPGATDAVPALRPIADFEIGRGTNHSAVEAIERISGCESADTSSAHWNYAVHSRHVPNMPPTGYQGSISNVVSNEVDIIEDEASWDKTWARHGGQLSCKPMLDFKDQVMLVVFGGVNGAFLSQVEAFYQNGDWKITLVYGYSDATPMYSVPDNNPIGGPFLFIPLVRPRKKITVFETKYWAMSRAKPQTKVRLEYQLKRPSRF